MKRLLAGVFGASYLLSHLGGPARAGSVEKLAIAVEQSESRVAHGVARTSNAVAKIGEDAATHADPGDDIRVLATEKVLLEGAYNDLCRAVAAYAAGTNTALDTMASELAGITDAMPREAMHRLADQTRVRANQRLRQAQDVIVELGRVLVQAGDVEHVARCLELSREHEVRGEEFAAQVRQAQTAARSYTERANRLLGLVRASIGTT